MSLASPSYSLGAWAEGQNTTTSHYDSERQRYLTGCFWSGDRIAVVLEGRKGCMGKGRGGNEGREFSNKGGREGGKQKLGRFVA